MNFNEIALALIAKAFPTWDIRLVHGTVWQASRDDIHLTADTPEELIQAIGRAGEKTQ